MGVRNLNGIKERARKEQYKRSQKEKDFWKLIDTIKQSRQDALDFKATKNELENNGLENLYNSWYIPTNPLVVDDDSFIGSTGYNYIDVYYNPESNEVIFIEKDDIGEKQYSYVISEPNEESSDFFDNEYSVHSHWNYRLNQLATNLQPFLNNFFEWVEKISDDTDDVPKTEQDVQPVESKKKNWFLKWFKLI